VSKIPRERIDHAIELWSTGRSSLWCQHQLSERWGVTTRAARRYLQIARERLRATAVATAEDARERAERQLQAAYDCAADKSDAKAMVLAASRLGELAGVLGTQRVELTGKNGGAIETATIVQVIELPPLEDETNAVATEPGTANAIPGVNGG
jgi:hypothetical protein